MPDNRFQTMDRLDEIETRRTPPRSPKLCFHDPFKRVSILCSVRTNRLKTLASIVWHWCLCSPNAGECINREEDVTFNILTLLFRIMFRIIVQDHVQCPHKICLSHIDFISNVHSYEYPESTPSSHLKRLKSQIMWAIYLKAFLPSLYILRSNSAIGSFAFHSCGSDDLSRQPDTGIGAIDLSLFRNCRVSSRILIQYVRYQTTMKL